MAKKHKRVLKRKPKTTIPSVFRCPECRKSTLQVAVVDLLDAKKGVVKCTNNWDCKQQPKTLLIMGQLGQPVDFYSYYIDVMNGDPVPEHVLHDFEPLAKAVQQDGDILLADLELRTGLRSHTILRIIPKYSLALKYAVDTPYLVKEERSVDIPDVEDALVDHVRFTTDKAKYKMTEKTFSIKIGSEVFIIGRRKLVRRFLKRLKLDPKVWLKKPSKEVAKAIGTAPPKDFELGINNGIVLTIRAAKKV